MEEIANLGDRRVLFYKRFGQYFRTKTRDTSEYELKYFSGLLRMETDRNLASVGRKTRISGQNLQHFVSNSPWLGEEVILAVENEVKVHPAFQEVVLVLDESTEEKTGKTQRRSRSAIQWPVREDRDEPGRCLSGFGNAKRVYVDRW